MCNRGLYEQIILDHNKNPKNFRVLPDANRQSEGYNPLCGDHYTVYLKLENDQITDISFNGVGCAISKASASIMTQLLKGKTKKEAEDLFAKFHQMVTSDPDKPVNEQELGKLYAFAGVREFPVRIKCATLAWHAMLAALDGKNTPITTE